jgi:hypothetical protein
VILPFNVVCEYVKEVTISNIEKIFFILV